MQLHINRMSAKAKMQSSSKQRKKNVGGRLNGS
jgi:hypothetical protein